MIRLINGYAITADGNSYALCKLVVASANAKPPRVPGEEYPVQISWHSSLGGCVRACIRRVQRDSVADGSVTTLQEAARLCEAVERQINALAFPGEATHGR